MTTTHGPTIAKRITDARARLAADLGELQHRVTRARELISPRTYLRSPWLKIGLGLAAGLLVGRRRKPLLLTSGDAPAPAAQPGGIVRAAVRAAVTALVGAAIEKAVEHLTSRPSDPEDSL